MSDPTLMLDWYDKGGNASIPAPPVCVCLLTYQRTSLALKTIQGIVENLDYPLPLLSWYIADDGSSDEHFGAIWKCLQDAGHKISGYHHERMGPFPYCGAGWNRAMSVGHEHAPILLWLEDDWVLMRKMDIRPYVRLLQEREDVGLVRLAHLPVGNTVFTTGHNGIHYLQYLRTNPYAYSGNPLLRHVRMRQAYGDFATDRTPGEVELDYDEKYHNLPGPDIWRPVDLGGWGIFGHIGTDKTW